MVGSPTSIDDDEHVAGNEEAQLDTIADDLYSLAPEEFTAARNAREKEARSSGDKELAAAIHTLGRPNAVAWLANQLVRGHRDEIEPLLALGADLREATANLSGERLRELSKQQHQIVYALVQQAKSLAAAAGRRVSSDTERGLEDTLRAALADADAAQELIAGRLTDALVPGGFGPPSPRAQPDRPNRGGRTTGSGAGGAGGTADRTESVEQRRARRIEEAERALAEAEASAAESASARDDARATLHSAEVQASQATERVKQLDDELERATAERSRAEAEQRKARSTLDRAERTLREAQRQVDLASARRERLGDSE